MYAISRLAKYKFSDCGGVLKEALRILPNYDNPDCDPTQSHLNVQLIECNLNGLTPEKYILKYKEDHNIKGRFNTYAKNKKNMTNCMMQSLFTASPEFFDGMSNEQIVEFFKECLQFFRTQFPEVPILSAIVHLDETTPHMHVTFLPIVERDNPKTGDKESIFSTTLLMPGRDFLPKYQENFYQFISSKYDNIFERGYSDRKNMSVKDYKQFQDLWNDYYDLKDKYESLQSEIYNSRKTIYNQKMKISHLYDELKAKNNKNSLASDFLDLLEKIPLLGLFIEVFRELNSESQKRILHNAIESAKRERDRAFRDLDSQINEAQGLSQSKRELVQRLFGKNNRDYR